MATQKTKAANAQMPAFNPPRGGNVVQPTTRAGLAPIGSQNSAIASAASEKPQSPMDVSMDNLRASIRQLGNDICYLASRLDPVMVPELPTEDATSDCAKPAMCSELQLAINSQADYVETMSYHVRAYTARLSI